MTVNKEQSHLERRLKLLLEVNASINSTIDTEALLRKIIEVGAIVMNTEASSLALLDPVSNELVFQLAEGTVGKMVETVRLPVGQGISGWVAQNGKHLIVNDVTNDPRFYKGVDKKSSFQTKSIMCIPMTRAGKIIGVLQALNKKDGTDFSEDDLILFQSLGNIAAIAIENSQLYRLLNKKVLELQKTNDRLNKILNQLEQSETEVRELQSHMKDQDTLNGKLEVFALANLLQMLTNDQKSGTLSLQHNDFQGRIHFNNFGQIVHAEMGKTPHLKGYDAMYEMMGWMTGIFSFSPKIKEFTPSIETSCMHLLIEGYRRSDELKVIQEEFTPLEPIKIADVDLGKITIKLNKIKIFILKNLSTPTSPNALWKASKLDQYSLYIELKELADHGLISQATKN